MLIIIFLIFLSKADQFEIVSDVKELKGDISTQRYPVKDVNGQYCAILKVFTDIKDLQFKGFGYEKHDYKDGSYLVYMQTNSKNLTFMKDGFTTKPHNFPFKLQSNIAYGIELKGVGEKIEDISINIIGEPENSIITLDGIEKGKIKSLKTSVGKHELKVSKDGFHTFTKSINVSSDKTMFEYKLKKIEDALLVIDSYPSGATVYLNDIELGMTPVSTFYPVGDFKIKLTSKDYEDIEETIQINSPETKKKYQLTDIRATLTINTHEKAKVYINGDQITYLENIKLSPQQCLIQVEMNKAKTIEERVLLGKKENKTLDLYPEIATGTIQIAVIPTDAEIEFWEDGGASYTNSGAKSFANVPIGNYTLKVYKKGYKTETTKLRLTADAIIKKSVKLEEGIDVSGNYTFVQGGTFQMGSNVSADEKPIHTVTVEDFYIGTYEVTVEEFRNFVEDTHYVTDAEKGKGSLINKQGEWNRDKKTNWKYPGFYQTDNHPVTCVSWNDAIEYCLWLSKKENAYFRLPTEAEWEYAAKGGNLSKSDEYSGSNLIDVVAWYSENSMENTNATGKLHPNELGIYDMSGNVTEWCSDWYDKDHYYSSQSYNPTGPLFGSDRVIRGGSWINNSNCCRVSYRSSSDPDVMTNAFGFRVVLSP